MRRGERQQLIDYSLITQSHWLGWTEGHVIQDRNDFQQVIPSHPFLYYTLRSSLHWLECPLTLMTMEASKVEVLSVFGCKNRSLSPKTKVLPNCSLYPKALQGSPALRQLARYRSGSWEKLLHFSEAYYSPNQPRYQWSILILSSMRNDLVMLLERPFAFLSIWVVGVRTLQSYSLSVTRYLVWPATSLESYRSSTKTTKGQY